MKVQKYNYEKYLGNGEYTNKPGNTLINMRDLERADDGGYIKFPHTCAGDYVGTKVERANKLVIMDAFGEVEGVHEALGGWSSSMVVIKESLIIEGSKDFNEELREVFDAIVEYPLLDDDALYQLEAEAEAAAWDSWIRFDLLRALEQAGKIQEPGVVMECDSRMQDIKERFYNIMREGDIYWVHEDINAPWADLDKVAEVW